MLRYSLQSPPASRPSHPTASAGAESPNARLVTAGTVSLLIGLPTIAVRVVRHTRRRAYHDPADLTATIADGCRVGDRRGHRWAAGPGSVGGEGPAGGILIVSATRVFRHGHRH